MQPGLCRLLGRHGFRLECILTRLNAGSDGWKPACAVTLQSWRLARSMQLCELL